MMEVHWSLELYTNKCVKQFSIIHMYIPSSVTATDTDASPPCVSRIRKVYVTVARKIYHLYTRDINNHRHST